jgi:hypothetical protein
LPRGLPCKTMGILEMMRNITHRTVVTIQAPHMTTGREM